MCMKERQLEKVKDATSYAVAAQERVRETGMQTQRDRNREREGQRERERKERRRDNYRFIDRPIDQSLTLQLTINQGRQSVAHIDALLQNEHRLVLGILRIAARGQETVAGYRFADLHKEREGKA